MAKGIRFNARIAEESELVQGFPTTLGLIYNEPSPPPSMKTIRDGLFGPNPTEEHVEEVIKRLHKRIEEFDLVGLMDGGLEKAFDENHFRNMGKGRPDLITANKGGLRRKFDPERFSKRTMERTMRDVSLNVGNITSEVANGILGVSASEKETSEILKKIYEIEKSHP